jgi:zinc/manganese transport system substrate-binding protein
VRVVAAENFWGNIAAEIGGRHVRVTSIISDPSADPHLYASNAANAAAVAQAQVVIENGVGYDTFMGDLLGASGAHPVVVSAQTVLGVNGADANPHLWYDIPRVPAVAAAIERSLASADPADKAAFQAKLNAFNKSLVPIEAVVAQIKAKYAGVPVAYTERVAGYLLNDAGLSVASPPGFAAAIENGNEPAPGDVQAMDSLLGGHKVRLLLYNQQAVSAVTQRVRALAQQNGIPVIGVSETLPPTDRSYQAWQLRQAREILRALGG